MADPELPPNDSDGQASGNSSFGKASLIIGLASLLGFVGIFVAFANLINQPEFQGLNRIELMSALEVSGQAQNLALFATLCLVATVIGLGLGILGLRQKDIPKIPSWVGSGINGVMLLIFLLFLLTS